MYSDLLVCDALQTQVENLQYLWDLSYTPHTHVNDTTHIYSKDTPIKTQKHNLKTIVW